MTTSNQNRTVLAWRGLCLFGAILASAPDVHAVTANANAPWQLLDGAFDSTVRGAWLLGLPDEPASNDVFKLLGNALLLMGADQGAMAGGRLYRVDGALSVSPDAGRQWFALAPQCALNTAPSLGAVAVDRGQPGHVVVAADPRHPDLDIGGCQGIVHCNNRQIAWTSDVGPQVEASAKATTEGYTATSAHDIDFAGFAASSALTSPGWRFSTIAHLVRTSLKGRLANADCDYDPAVMLSRDNICATSITFKTVCHGVKATDVARDAERFCPNEPATCACRGIGANDVPGIDGEAAHCDAPIAASLAIDPRNGFAYASGATGVLLARDGGRIWERYGAGEHNHWSATGAPAIQGRVEARSPLAAANPTSRGAGLLTLQGLPRLADVGLDQRLADLLALDLNAQPEYIQSMGAISLHWQPCGGPSPPTYGNGRVRGDLLATVAVTWVNPRLPGYIDAAGAVVLGQVLSGVFVAAQDGRCGYRGTLDAPGPLVFRDSAN